MSRALILTGGAVIIAGISYILGHAAAYWNAAELLTRTAQALVERYEEGRWQGWHEPHSCDTACLDRILGPVAKATSSTPNLN
jgi:hypothetical protein